MSVLAFTVVCIFAANVLIIAAAVFGVRASLAAAGWERERVHRGVLLIATLLIAWLAMAVVLGMLGAYTAEAQHWPSIQFGIAIPIIVGVVLYRRSQFLRDILAAVPQSWIIGIQFYRTLGFIFLVLYAAALLPGFFALPAGIGDIAVGATALIIAAVYGSARNPPAGIVVLWNAFGIADLIVAVATGFLSSPSPLQVAAFHLPNQLITELPLVLVPTFAVPLAILLHLASLAKARDTIREMAGVAPA
jgi:hypothetical protein